MRAALLHNGESKRIAVRKQTLTKGYTLKTLKLNAEKLKALTQKQTKQAVGGAICDGSFGSTGVAGK